MTLDKIYSKLQGNLYKPYLFIIPSSILPEDKKELLDSPGVKSFFDSIMYINPKGETLKVITTESIYPLLTKTAVLDKNMFLLLEQKRKLSETELKFLLDKYFDSLEFYANASSWMHNNLSDLETELYEDVLIYFETQNRAFQKHLEDFYRYFPKYNHAYPKTKPLDWSQLNKSDFPPLQQMLPNEKVLSALLKAKKQPGVAKAKKRPVVCDEQVRRYLLETVFTIKF